MFSSFVIFFHTKRLENFHQTIRFLNLWHPEVVQESEIITICQDQTNLTLSNWLHHSHINLDLECMHLPKMVNIGVNLAKSNKLVILESDRILPKGYFFNAIQQLKEGLQITAKNMIKLTKDYNDNDIINNNYEFKEDNRTSKIGDKNLWSGNTIITKNDFNKIGGMDEFYKGYGWADSDMCEKTKHLQSIYRDEQEIHLWHPPLTYGKGDQKQMFIDNGIYFCKKWKIEFPLWFREELLKSKKYFV